MILETVFWDSERMRAARIRVLCVSSLSMNVALSLNAINSSVDEHVT